MSRKKDDDKRQAILAEAKRLFALKGYSSTSMGEVAEALEIPVGSLYTYFPSKDALLDTIMEEGWREFHESMESGMRALLANPPQSCDAESKGMLKLAYMIRVALPRLFDDLELISILLTQYPGATRFEEKLDYLASSIEEITMECASLTGGSVDLRLLRPGLAVMLLGSLEVMRLIHRGNIALTGENVISFLATTVEAALGCSLPLLDAPGS